MNSKFLFSLSAVFILSLIIAAAVNAAPVTIDSVHVNGDQVITTDPNRLDLIRGQTLDVKVRLTGISNSSDVEVRGFISGFEHNREQPISDVTPTFDVESGVTYVKRLQLRLPDLAEEDNYLLRIIASDRNGAELIQNFRIKIDVKRHNLVIRDLVLNPEQGIAAGRALLATVRLKNMGEQDEEGIRIKVSISELGISAIDYIDELESDESTTSEELFLRIPSCAKPGDYTVKATVEYNDGFDTVSSTKNIRVEKTDACAADSSSPDSSNEKTTIIVSSEPQTIVPGELGAIYSATISNAGSTQKIYTLTAEGFEEWGTVKISPSNVVILNAGEAKGVSLLVSGKPGATAGDRTFIVTVKDQSGKMLQQFVMRAKIQAQKEDGGLQLSGMRKFLEIGIILLVLLVIIIALLFVFKKMKGKEEEENESEPKTYY